VRIFSNQICPSRVLPWISVAAMIAIIDYGSGNVAAIANIYKQLKVDHYVSSDLHELTHADRYILPGVGAFDITMQHLRNTGMVDLLNEHVLSQKKKLLGICVGMQILAESSEEGATSGLGWIAGNVRKIDASTLTAAPHLPHMGWNAINLVQEHPLFDSVDPALGFYFLHNYFFDAIHNKAVLATVHYGKNLTCAVMRENVFGLQFHPEKSHSNGVAVFRNFAKL